MMRSALLAGSVTAALRVSSLESSSRSISCEQLLDGLRAHAGTGSRSLVLFAHVAVLLLGQDLLLHQRRVARIGDDIVCKVQDLLQYARG